MSYVPCKLNEGGESVLLGGGDCAEGDGAKGLFDLWTF